MLRLVALVIVSLGIAGCSKKEDASGDASAPLAVPDGHTKSSAGAELIPGQNGIQEALATKDYAGAVQRYVSLKAAVATPEQTAEYVKLFGELRDDLQNAAQTEPPAAEALNTLRAIRNGR